MIIPSPNCSSEIYIDLPFPSAQVALNIASEHNFSSMINHEWRCSKPFTTETVLAKLKEKGIVMVFDSNSASGAGDISGAAINHTFRMGDQAVAAVHIEKNRANLVIIGISKVQTSDLLKQFIALYPPVEPPKDAKIVQVGFWVRGSQGGPKKFPRDIEVMPLDTIQNNYDPKTKELLVDLAKFKPTKGGQILLFSGIPGTGKTHAIRSLLWQWKDWAEFHYVVDPNTFFGDQPDYLMKVIFNEFGDDAPYLPREGSDNEPDQVKWKIILLEDAGDLVRVDAKEHIRQGMGQLLNLTDGMLGQGLKLVFLITTNEELGRLDPAITRPGRCAVRHEFHALDKDTSNQWLKDHKSEELVTDSATIAQLYSKLDGSDKKLGFNPTPPDKKAGFLR